MPLLSLASERPRQHFSFRPSVPTINHPKI
jgi:hypothetical protein